jgi:hypothetical protein
MIEEIFENFSGETLIGIAIIVIFLAIALFFGDDK